MMFFDTSDVDLNTWNKSEFDPLCSTSQRCQRLGRFDKTSFITSKPRVHSQGCSIQH